MSILCNAHCVYMYFRLFSSLEVTRNIRILFLVMSTTIVLCLLVPSHSGCSTLFRNVFSVKGCGHSSILSLVFICVILVNLRGSMPYTYGLTTRGSFVVVLIFTAWGVCTIPAFTLGFQSRLAHFLPSGSPSALVPLLICIEVVRIFLRPATLRLRILANISIGHVVIALLDSIILPLTFFIIYEFFVAVVQSYIMALLLISYNSE